MPAFSFYTDITPLDSNIHRKLRYQPVTDYSFAKKTQLAPLGTSEFFDCAVEFPIVFIRTPRGLVPVALFGARPDENTFISAKGKWDSSYRPMFIQRYPFVTLQEANERLSVGFDKASSAIQENDGELLFKEDGQPSSYFANQIKFFEQAHGEFFRGEALAKSLDAKKLLQPMSAQMSTEGGERVELTGFEVVDIAKLDAMSAEEQGPLAKTGELALIHAHLVSMRNFKKLLRRLEPQLAE